MKYLLCLFLIILPTICSASSGWEALLGVGAIQVLLFVWPFIVPFFFLPEKNKKFAHYLVLLILVYGIRGLVNAPFSFLLQVGVWFNSSYYGWGYTVATQVVGFCISIYVLIKYSAICTNAVNEYSSE